MLNETEVYGIHDARKQLYDKYKQANDEVCLQFLKMILIYYIYFSQKQLSENIARALCDR